jgi:hypothetical protein
MDFLPIDDSGIVVEIRLLRQNERHIEWRPEPELRQPDWMYWH